MRFFVLIVSFSFLTNGFCQDESEPEESLPFAVIESTILRVFPEAYKEFLSVTYSRLSDFIVPENATFLIPDKHFKKSLNQKVLDKRAELVLEQLELLPACFSISYGEVLEYAWHSWEDKKVRKVTLTFGIGC